MGFKRIFFSKVICEGSYSFDSLLRNKKHHKTIEIGDKKIEVSHILVESTFITGLFVSTQETGIAPLHKPGDEEDYSAVPVPIGKGFAFPNVFVYLRELNVFAWESNRSGQAEKGMADYFNTISRNNILDINVFFEPIMNLDAFDRVGNLVEIDKIDLQIAEPTTSLKSEIGTQGSISDIYNLAKKTNSTKFISISIAANEKKKDKLSKDNIIEILRGFVPIQSNKIGKVKNKLVITGKQRGKDGRLIEEAINIVLNRYEDKFSLEKLKIAPHLQITERKEGILGAVISKLDLIKKLL